MRTHRDDIVDPGEIFEPEEINALLSRIAHLTTSSSRPSNCSPIGC